MLQAHTAIGARAFDAAASVNASAGPAPDHVDPLLWQLASPVERELLRFVAGQGAAGNVAYQSPSFPTGTLGTAAGLRTAAAPAANDPAPPAATTASAASSSPEQAALVKVTDQFRARFSEAAKNPAQFNETLKKAFGDKYDAAAAEGIRQQALRNDFSWMPKVEVVSGAQLADQSGTQGAGEGRGAYAKDTDTIYLSRELLLSDPAAAGRVLTEEVGHAIDARINAQDAAGDEGDIFSALLHGDSVSDAQLQAMRADNDHGTITVNGRQVDVEYGWLKKAFKKVTGAIKSVGNFVKNTVKAGFDVAVGVATFDFSRVKQGLEDGFDAAKQLAKDAVKMVKETWNDIKGAFVKLMQSKLFNAILMVARFIPIPVVQLVVRVIDIAKAAYSVYQGVKNKSWGAVVGGVASLAGGAAGMAGKLGASASTVNTIQNFADTAKNVATAYNAVSSKNFGDAALSLASAFDASPAVVDALKTARTVEQVVKAVDNKDYGSALVGVGDLAAGQAGKAVGIDADTAAQVRKVGDAAQQVQKVVTAVETKDFGRLATAAGALGAGAAEKLFDASIDKDTAQDAQKLVKAGKDVAAVVAALDKKDYGGAVFNAAAVANGPIGEFLGIHQEDAGLRTATGRAAQQVQAFVKTVERDDHASAVRQGAQLLGLERQDRLPGDATAPKPTQQTVALQDLWARWEAAATAKP